MSICAFYMPTEGKRNFNLQTKSNGKNKLKKQVVKNILIRNERNFSSKISFKTDQMSIIAETLL